MKKIILSIAAMLLVSSVVLAEGISFTEKTEWKTLLAQAKRENRLIFLDAYATWCGPCNYLQKDVFTQQEVGDYFNKTYINVRIDMEAGEGPELAEKYGVTAYPTLFFVNGDGKVVHKYVGALSAADLLGLGKDASNPEKQYYTLKSKAENAELTLEAFDGWIHAAQAMEDEDLDNIITSYLDKTTYPLTDEFMLDIIFEHASVLPERILNDIVAHKVEVMKIMSYTEADFKQAIITKAVSLALEKSAEGETIDFKLFNEIVAKYSPEKAALETQLMLVKYCFYKKENDKGLDELHKLIADKTLNLSVIRLAVLMTERAAIIVDAKRGTEFINMISTFQLNADDVKIGYYKDLALLPIYARMEDKEKTAGLIKKIKESEDIPDELKKLTAHFEAED